MTKLTIEELPAEVVERLRELRDPLEVLDGEKTIATIYPVRGGVQYAHIPDPALGRLGDYRPSPSSFDLPFDAAEELIKDRREEEQRKKW